MSEQEKSVAPGSSPSRAATPEVPAAERAVAAIMTGIKNYAVFPPEHASTVNMIQTVLRTVNDFTGRFGGLGFEVERQSLSFQGKILHDGPPSDENPAFVLHRAGISRFEFLSGLVEPELITFFQLYNHYRIVGDEAEDDLVSALWRAGLPHIFYKASYELWSDAANLLDLEHLQPVAPAGEGAAELVSRPGGGWESRRPAPAGEESQQLGQSLADEEPGRWALTSEEGEVLAEQVRREKAEGGLADSVRLMYFLLVEAEEPAGCESILGFLQDIYLNFLSQRRFRQAGFILEHLRRSFQADRAKKPWALPCYQKFYASLIKPELLEKMVLLGSGYDELEASELMALAGIFQQLPSRAALELVSLLERLRNEAAGRLFHQVVLSFARKVPAILAAALGSSSEELVLAAVGIVKERNDPKLVEEYLQKFRYDGRSRIRQESVRILASHGIYS